MERLTSLAHVPAETRRLLRQRLPAALPTSRATPYRDTDGVLDDETYLAAMLDWRVALNSEVGTARAIYERALSEPSDELAFESLAGQGWIRIAWGRVSANFEVARRAQNANRPGLAALLSSRHKSRKVGGEDGFDPDVGCLTPSWVAARLWERRDCDIPIAEALHTWVDRWSAMRGPHLVPTRDWRPVDADAFRGATLSVVETVAGLQDWDQVRERLINEAAIIAGGAPSEAETWIPSVPVTLIDRVGWLDHPGLERSMTGAYLGSPDVNGLVQILLADVEAAELSRAPNELAARLAAIAIQRPDMLFNLVHHARQSPLLVVDLLFVPATSAWACLLVAQWEPPAGAWDRELVERDVHFAKASAFADAVAVMCHFLAQGAVPAEEVAALLQWLHSDPRGLASTSPASPRSLSAALEAALAKQPPDALDALVEAFLARLATAKTASCVIPAALAMIDLAGAADTVEPRPIVEAYLRELDDPPYASLLHKTPAAAAATLTRIAARLPPQDARRFLDPIDIRECLAINADDNPYTVVDTIARALRIHVRVLCRAIADLKAKAPDDLIDALAAALRAGALTHREKGRVSIFSPRIDAPRLHGDSESLAADMAAALTSVAADGQAKLVAAITETDEPLILAQLATLVPRPLRAPIAQRIDALTPTTAGEIFSLPEAQARIDQLLAAEMPAAAARFIEEEAGLKTFGKAPGRDVAQLQAQLRLRLLEGDWDAIASAEVPAGLEQQDAQTASAAIELYRALAELRKPDGDMTHAATTFRRLAERRPNVPAYAVNLIAAQVNMLLRDDAFAVLDGDGLTSGRRILSEAAHFAARTQDKREADALSCNVAVLELATGRPDAALASLATVTDENLTDKKAAYSALALHRLGRTNEADAMLAAAKASFGAGGVIEGVERHLKTGAAFADAAPTSLDDDPSIRVRLALAEFRQMDPMRQAQALSSEREPFDAVVIEHVRSAGASIVGLTPMLRTIATKFSEDDLSAFVQNILMARVEHMGWHVPDQSRGGHTAKGNPGERDLIICKGAVTLAVIEAVVCDRPAETQWSTAELTSHFQKLVGYDTCGLFFHLTYARIEKPASILRVLHERIKTHVPAGYEFIGADDIPLTDGRPTGRIARYKGEFGEVKVVFLVLDLGQHIQKEAAKAADKTNPRRTRASSKKTKTA